MAADRTELEWTYQPADSFEAAYILSAQGYDLVVDAGRAVATLHEAQDPVPDNVKDRINREVALFFKIRQLQTHRQITVQEDPSIHQYRGNSKVTVTVRTINIGASFERADVVVKDAEGHVVRDTKAERITRDSALLDSLVPKAAGCPALTALFESYSRAISDPANELVHLYEIRDALGKYYGNETNARKALSISKRDWQHLGLLADVEPLKQGRHRGRHAQLRDATASELNDARRLVRGWIVAFAETLQTPG